jgi:hypothetical protein
MAKTWNRLPAKTRLRRVDEQAIGLCLGTWALWLFVTARAAVSATYSLAQQLLLSYNRLTAITKQVNRLTASIAITASMADQVRNVRLGW